MARLRRVRVAEVFSLNAKLQSRPDLLLLLSLLVAILLTPALNQDNWRRLVLAAVTFIPIVLSIVRLSQVKKVGVAVGSVGIRQCGFCGGGEYVPDPDADRNSMGISRCLLRAHGHRSFLISQEFSFGRSGGALHCCQHLLIAWVAVGSDLSIDAFSPGSIRIGSDPSDRQTELLYFSLITLSTVGYGDIVPLSGMARILTALEGVTGVLYIATTVAVLVGRFRNESWE